MDAAAEEDPLAATALPSLATSACLVCVLYKFSSLGALPLHHVLFFALLPTVAALACLQEKRFLATFKRLFQWCVLRSEVCDDPDNNWQVALLAARNELLKSIGDRWPTPRGGGSGPFSLSRFASPAALDPSISTGVGAGGNNDGKSLYDRVRSKLTDHEFPKSHDAPIYFMDPTNGSFLRVNEQHKLVFTETPDASCLFHVVKGKTHHWGFYSAIYQRYIGMNVLNKVVVSSKKMQSWESFRILERPEKSGADDAKNSTGFARTVYFVLCSARFGKGMWLGRRRRTPANPTDTYLTKNFTHALALVYASDLSAFQYISEPRGSVVDSQSLSDSASDLQLSSSSLISSTVEDDPFGSDFQAPILQTAARSKVVLPWIAEGSSRRFLELPERGMVDIVSTTISKCTLREFLEFFIDQDARRMCHQKTSQAPSSYLSSSGVGQARDSDDQRMSEWHLHAQFGFIRKLSYRPPAPSESASDGLASSSRVASTSASVAIDQFDSCSVDEKSMQKAVFRSKLFTLSIPKSNCFSIEVVFELQDTQERDGIYALAPINPMVVIKCRAGVHFKRKTMFSSQIEKGVFEGVKNACAILLKLADEYRTKLPADGRLSSTFDSSSQMRPRRDAFPPHTLAVEIIKGLINAIRGSDRVGTSITRRGRSSLNIQMPWTPASLPMTSTRSSKTVTPVNQPRLRGFFESLPQSFERIVDETMPNLASPSLVFDALLSDECSFFHAVNSKIGTMEVDIGAWRGAQFPVEGSGDVYSFLRKQLFRMPVAGVLGLDVAQIEDYQYYTLQRPNSSAQQNEERLEFGMKIFARDLPDGEHFSIEVLVVVSQCSPPADSNDVPVWSLQVSYAIAKNAAGASHSDDDPIHAALVQGTVRGLKKVWTRVGHVIQDAVVAVSRQPVAPNSVLAEHLLHRLQVAQQLPTHDELTARIIESITSLY